MYNVLSLAAVCECLCYCDHANWEYYRTVGAVEDINMARAIATGMLLLQGSQLLTPAQVSDRLVSTKGDVA